MSEAAAPPSATTPARPARGRSLFDDALRRLKRNPAAMASLVVLGVLALLAIFGPMLWVHPIDEIFRDQVAAPPTWKGMHILGTDTEGRDMMARLLFGLRVSLLVGLIATFVALGVGVAWGAIAGFFGGVIDVVMMRIVEVIYAVPFIFFVIVLVTVVQTTDPVSNLVLVFLAVGAVEWLTMARIVRGQAISLKAREFVDAARAAGAGPLTIVFRHIVPNLLGPVLIFATLNVPIVIMTESFLSFLGLGVQEPLTSLGRLIAVGAREMRTAPWMLFSPAATMLVALLALNFLGDGLRDAFDPKER